MWYFVTNTQHHGYGLWQLAVFLTNPGFNWLIVMYSLLKSPNSVILWISVLFNSDTFQFTAAPAQTVFTLTPTLLNGLFLIHPILILTGFAIIIQWSQASTQRYQHHLFQWSRQSTSSGAHLNLLVLLILCGVFLGGWWAYQELGWGGWWSWDPVEIINLVLLVLCLHASHSPGFLRATALSTTHNIFVLVLVLHLTVRFDLFNSVHSFLTAQPTYYSALIGWGFVYLLLPCSTPKSYLGIWRLDNVGMGWVLLGLCIGLNAQIWGIGNWNVWWGWIYICALDIFTHTYLHVFILWVIVLLNNYILWIFVLYRYFNSTNTTLQLTHTLIAVLVTQIVFNQHTYFPVWEPTQFKWISSWIDLVVSFHDNTYTVVYQQFALWSQHTYPTVGIFSYVYTLTYPFLYPTNSEHMEMMYNLYNWYFCGLGFMLVNFKNIIYWWKTRYKKWCII